MLSYDANPVLAEAADVSRELARTRRVAAGGTSPRAALAADAQQALEGRLQALYDDPESREIIDSALTERAATLRAAVTAWRATLAARELRQQAAAVATDAARDGRSLIQAEALLVATLHGRADRIEADRELALQDRLTTEEARDGALAALAAIRVREARAQLRRGLLLTGQMRAIIAEATPALTRGEPLLLLGETGGAKTALAEYLSRVELGSEPELVSGYGDITSSQLIGSHELRSDGGATVSVFVPGPLLRAMTEGRPVILDEVNAMPAEFLKRLNRILQLRPGQSFAVQENNGDAVEIAQGFAILATANEQTPHRYRGIDRMSAELVNRFGANSYRVHYPDAGLEYTEAPRENALLAAAAIADATGNVPLPTDDLERVARAAFISQQVFAGAHGEGFGRFVSTEREIDGRPGLEESVLAPRTLVAIVQKVAGSAGQVTLDHALSRFVDGVMHAEDRQVLSLILRSQGFLAGARVPAN